MKLLYSVETGEVITAIKIAGCLCSDLEPVHIRQLVAYLQTHLQLIEGETEENETN